MVAKKSPATYEDLLAAPENMVAEIINGELVLSPRPASRHGRAATRISGNLHPFDKKPSDATPGGWHIVIEPELHLGAQVVVPDLAGWRRERMPQFLDVPWFELVPDWVCEIASPSTQRYDRIMKSAIYLDAGVAWMWLVTPHDQRVEVFEAVGGRWTVVKTAVGDEPERLPPFDALELDVASWWSFD